MHTKEFITALAKELGLSQKEAKATFVGVINTIKESTIKSGSLTIQGFGTFKIKDIKARNGVNPATGEKIVIPARKAFRFKAGWQLSTSL